LRDVPSDDDVRPSPDSKIAENSAGELVAADTNVKLTEVGYPGNPKLTAFSVKFHDEI
jgi:hypothetical protein